MLKTLSQSPWPGALAGCVRLNKDRACRIRSSPAFPSLHLERCRHAHLDDGRGRWIDNVYIKRLRVVTRIFRTLIERPVFMQDLADFKRCGVVARPPS